MSDPDLELVQACQAAEGEEFERAFQRVFALYQDRVFTICLRVCGNQEDALDAAQETLVTLARRIGDFQGRSRFSSWVYRIAVNAAIDIRRRRLDAPRAGVQTRVGEDAEWLAETAVEPDVNGPLAEVQRAEEHEQVRRALANINPRFSSLLTLRYIEGLSYEEISEVLDCNLGTVKSRLNRAHAALRAYLERHHDAGRA